MVPFYCNLTSIVMGDCRNQPQVIFWSFCDMKENVTCRCYPYNDTVLSYILYTLKSLIEWAQ